MHLTYGAIGKSSRRAAQMYPESYLKHKHQMFARVHQKLKRNAKVPRAPVSATLLSAKQQTVENYPVC